MGPGPRSVRARDGSKRLAVTNGGTIPDRGLFGVFLPDGTRVGELDEEMVYESRPGETFVLGASTWRIEDITFERVTVTPAPGQPGKMPFWHGDRPGRPLELGRALGAFVREIRELAPAAATERSAHALRARRIRRVATCMQYLAEQDEATGAVPDDRTVVVERFQDEIGDWRVCILSPFGTPVHAPWAMAIERRLMDRFDIPVETMWGDDGIVIRLPESADELPIEALMIDPEDIDELVVATLPQTALFSAGSASAPAGRCCCRVAVPIGAPRCGSSASAPPTCSPSPPKYPTFPILLETSRECLQDVFDVPALREVLGQLRSRAIRVVTVDTGKASPMASSLLFNWIAAYMYEGDAPLAERRAAALALDRDLLRDLLGAEELRELLDPDVLADVELELQCLADGRRARSADELHDVFRKVGDLTADEVDLRCETGTAVRRAVARRELRRRDVGSSRSRVAGETRFAAAEDAARYRDALRVLAAARVADGVHRSGAPARSRSSSVGMPARTVRSSTADVAGRFGRRCERIAGALAALEGEERIVVGEFRPEGVSREFCDVDVLRQLRRRSLAALRQEVEPVEQEAFARFLPAWHGIPAGGAGLDALVETLGVLSGAALVASTLEADVLPVRVAGLPPVDARRTLHGGRGRVGRRRGARCARRSHPAVLRRSTAAARTRMGAAGARRGPAPRRDPSPARPSTVRASGARSAAPRPGRRIRSSSLRCGISCGPARSPNDSLAPLRAVLGGAKVGASSKRQRAVRTDAPAAGSAHAHRTARRAGPMEPRRRRCCARRRRRPRRHTPRRCNSSSATAS